MNKVSISEAAKLANVSRSHLYKAYIATGDLSVLTEDGKKVVEISELIRVFGHIQFEDSQKTPENTAEDSLKTTEQDTIVQLLERQLAESKERENDFKAREKWLTDQIDELRYQQSHLLEDKTANQKQKRKKFLGLF